ncbi:MAG TPA: hypothetical protein VFY40_15995, partial [Blastocatellia bacterium]|nr:hypothetical protein [Blastocatellia bacterium]
RARRITASSTCSTSSEMMTTGALIGTRVPAQEANCPLKQGCHQPPLVTEDGRVLEGNRRVTALRKLQAEHPKSKQWETITIQQLVKKISPEQEMILAI